MKHFSLLHDPIPTPWQMAKDSKESGPLNTEASEVLVERVGRRFKEVGLRFHEAAEIIVCDVWLLYVWVDKIMALLYYCLLCSLSIYELRLSEA